MDNNISSMSDDCKSSSWFVSMVPAAVMYCTEDYSYSVTTCPTGGHSIQVVFVICTDQGFFLKMVWGEQ